MASKLKILVIEDNDRDAELLKRKLGKFDYTFAGTLKESKALLAENIYAAVLVDLTLTNGIKDTVLDEVRGVCGEAATIVLTGDTNPRTRDHMRHRKADAFAVKGKDDEQDDLEWIIYEAIKSRARLAKKKQ